MALANTGIVQLSLTRKAGLVEPLRGFTLAELLVVIALVGFLTVLLSVSLRQARMKARIVVVNSDLRQIGMALTCYFNDQKEYPPTREDCGAGTLTAHLHQLPLELAEGAYLPAASSGQAMSVLMEDPFHPGHTYKYRSVGECIRDRNQISRWIQSQLWVPNGFPAQSSLREEEGRWYSDFKQSPVEWVVFSLGPKFDEEWVWNETQGRYPVPHQTWLHRESGKGFLVRLRMKDGRELGTFEKSL